jgi:hypothetical protein
VKHVFECGIVGESNDEVGDTLLAGMMDIVLPPTVNKRLPDDFTLELRDSDFLRGGALEMMALRAKYETLCEGMVERGYEWMRWRDEEKFCEVLRFRRVRQPTSLSGGGE